MESRPSRLLSGKSRSRTWTAHFNQLLVPSSLGKYMSQIHKPWIEVKAVGSLLLPSEVEAVEVAVHLSKSKLSSPVIMKPIPRASNSRNPPNPSIDACKELRIQRKISQLLATKQPQHVSQKKGNHHTHYSTWTISQWATKYLNCHTIYYTILWIYIRMY